MSFDKARISLHKCARWVPSLYLNGLGFTAPVCVFLLVFGGLKFVIPV